MIWRVLIVLFLAGCGRRDGQLSTGTVIPASSLSGFHGSTAYAAVSLDALPALYSNFRDTLSERGLVKWDARFDCNHFASLYIAVAQTDYAVAAWHSDTPAQSLALSEVWVKSPQGTHALVCAMTESGPVYVEPQTGATVPAPAHILFQKW